MPETPSFEMIRAAVETDFVTAEQAEWVYKVMYQAYKKQENGEKNE